MKRSTAAVLFAVVLLAVAMRLLPLLRALYWGADFGEYLTLTGALAQDGVVSTAYDGWGVTYPWFPGLFFVNVAFVQAGMPVTLAASVVVPAIAGLAVLPMFLIAVRVTRDDIAGLAAAAFLAVILFHVYPTSHGIPASLGNVLLLGALLAFLGLRRSPKFFVPLVLTGLATVVTHHFATYVLLLVTVAALWARAALEPSLTVRALRYELAFLAILFAATIAYWTSAPPFWSLVVTHAPVSPALLIAAGALAVALVPVVAALRRRSGWRYRPRTPSVRLAAARAGLAVAVTFGIALAVAVVPVPGTSIRGNALDILAFAPVLLFLAPAPSGRRILDFGRGGVEITAWFVAILLSLVAGALAVPEVLIPYRHLEYLALPLAVMVGAGLRWLTLGVGRPRGKAAAAAVTLVLVGAAAAAAYPPSSAIAGYDEGIRPKTIEVALWARVQATGLVAGDHRVSTVVFGFSGLDATWDRETGMWHTASVDEAIAAMNAVQVNQRVERVDWVVVDEGMRLGVQTSPFARADPLLPPEEAKFTGTPFHKAFDAGFAQAYYVNWALAGG